tara:strand:- start:632 stop:871 length:240 start_codon:yes stop_codon:yes gene_type:complete
MESEFNDNQIIKRRVRPSGMLDWQWAAEVELHKSRYHVASKLKPDNFRKFIAWEKKHNLNHNSGLNRLIETHQDLQNND